MDNNDLDNYPRKEGEPLSSSKQKSPYAILSFLSGLGSILAVILSFDFWWLISLPVVALIFSMLGMKQISTSRGRYSGIGMVKFGMYSGFAMLILVLVTVSWIELGRI